MKGQTGGNSEPEKRKITRLKTTFRQVLKWVYLPLESDPASLLTVDL